MDIALGFLTFGTLGFVAVFGFLSARAMEEMRNRPTPKSALSRDGAAERRSRKVAQATN